MPTFELTGVVLDTPQPQELAAFYHRLTGWPITADDPTWCKLVPEGGGTGISIQLEPEHVRPSWPSDTAHQQMQLHLDLRVDDLDAAAAHAAAAGARLADFQPQDDVRVFLDPVGHPFCVFEN
jgi:hypothetical protein